MSFPDHPYPQVDDFASAYFEAYQSAAALVSRPALSAAVDCLGACYQRQNWVYACGNGGSASIANHMFCDHAKGVRTDTGLTPHMMSLSANVEMITALANDLSYADVYSYQLDGLLRPGDVVVTISSSGDSENVVRALETARKKGVETIALTGFDGGRTSRLADINIHVPADNYGVVEDLHQSVMHILAQAVRLRHMDAGLVSQRRF